MLTLIVGAIAFVVGAAVAWWIGAPVIWTKATARSYGEAHHHATIRVLELWNPYTGWLCFGSRERLRLPDGRYESAVIAGRNNPNDEPIDPTNPGDTEQ